MKFFRRLIGLSSTRAASPARTPSDAAGYKGLTTPTGSNESTRGPITSKTAASSLDDPELFTACGKAGGTDRLKALLRAGANVNVCNAEGYTPLFVACQTASSMQSNC